MSNSIVYVIVNKDLEPQKTSENRVLSFSDEYSAMRHAVEVLKNKDLKVRPFQMKGLF